KGEHEKAQVTKAFYDEYFAVLDLTAEFYLETVRLVFQECALPVGKLQWQGERVEPRAIKRTMLLTVEGERDDICAVGQTAAAHDLCTGLRPYLKRHHMQAGVGHYGVFSGNRWTNQIYPLLKNVIFASEGAPANSSLFSCGADNVADYGAHQRKNHWRSLVEDFLPRAFGIDEVENCSKYK